MANPMTPHCERFGCEFFTSYGEPMEACKRCGNPKGHATPDHAAAMFRCMECGSWIRVARVEGTPQITTAVWSDEPCSACREIRESMDATRS